MADLPVDRIHRSRCDGLLSELQTLPAASRQLSLFFSMAISATAAAAAENSIPRPFQVSFYAIPSLS